MNESSLVRQIELAFEGVPKPPKDGIVAHRCLECDRVARVFRGRHWKEMADDPTSFLSKLNLDFHPLLTVDARRFYLPLFMIACIRFPKKADFFCSSLIYSFVPPSKQLSSAERKTAQTINLKGIPGLHEDLMAAVRRAISESSSPPPDHAVESTKDYKNFMGALSKPQIRATLSFLEFMLERGDVDTRNIKRAINAVSAFKRHR